MKSLIAKSLTICVMVLLSGCYGHYRPYEQPVVKVTPNGVVIPECQSYDLSSEQAPVIGCFVESSRWQMMANPEKMAGTTEQTGTTSP